MKKLIEFSKSILKRIKKLEQPLTEQQIRYMAVGYALEFISKELARDNNDTTLAYEMDKLEEYTYIIEKIIKI